MGYYVPKEKPLCYNCQFRTGNYCGILTENEGVKDFVGTYNENPRCPLVEMEEPQTGKWIPVSKDTPKTSANVIISYKDGIALGWCTGKRWIKDGYLCETVKAWMPLPKAYEAKE